MVAIGPLGSITSLKESKVIQLSFEWGRSEEVNPLRVSLTAECCKCGAPMHFMAGRECNACVCTRIEMAEREFGF